MNTQILAAFFTYFAILLAIGLAAHKKQSSDADFVIGNRSLNFWLTALSAHASDMSAWLFMAFPAAVFIGGLPQIWTAIGLTFGMWCNWQFVATRLRTETEKYDSYTLSTYFERRYKDNSGVLRILTASVALIFLTSYLSAGLIAMGLLFESIFGIDYYIGISVATFVAMSYTFSGGFITVAWTDLFQAIFLLGMIILVPTAAYLTIPEGYSAIEASANSQAIALTVLPEVSFNAFFSILFLLVWGLGYFGQPHIVTKFMGIKNPKDLVKSKYVGITWQIIALTAAAVVGLVGIGYFPEGIANPELVFVDMVKGLFHPYWAGLILCGIIAANMSTMDSQILVCASILSEDFYKRMVKAASPRQLLRVSRFAVILIAIIALGLAYSRNTTVLDVVFYAWSGLGCSFGPLVLMSLYSKRVNKYGAIAGIITGGVFVGGLWGWLNPQITYLAVPALLPGFFLSLLNIYLVSILFEKIGCNDLVKTKEG
ncbi:MAG: sodium/proline symporter [Parachlamydiaceae bacterium]|nr:sodium/proline symporter [Parachlamydiaceae bacterium]